MMTLEQFLEFVIRFHLVPVGMDDLYQVTIHFRRLLALIIWAHLWAAIKCSSSTFGLVWKKESVWFETKEILYRKNTARLRAGKWTPLFVIPDLFVQKKRVSFVLVMQRILV